MGESVRPSETLEKVVTEGIAAVRLRAPELARILDVSPPPLKVTRRNPVITALLPSVLNLLYRGARKLYRKAIRSRLLQPALLHMKDFFFRHWRR